MKREIKDYPKKTHFDYWESNAIIKSVESDPYKAKRSFIEYFEKYPKDYYAYAYFIMALVKIGEFENAEELYNKVEKLANNDYHFNTCSKKVHGYRHNMLIAKAKILAYQERYRDLLYLYINNVKEFENNGGNYISYFCEIKLGLLERNKTDLLPYRFLQTLDYHEEAFLEHIKRHMQLFNSNYTISDSGVFAENFPIQKIISEIKKFIPSNNRICPGLFEDFYYFKYDKCGRYHNKPANFFVVIAFHNTQNFITMYPIFDNDKLPFTDLNYLKNENVDTNEKVKKLSQIEKFNRRYQR